MGRKFEVIWDSLCSAVGGRYVQVSKLGKGHKLPKKYLIKIHEHVSVILKKYNRVSPIIIFNHELSKQLKIRQNNEYKMKEFLTNRTAYWTSSTLSDGSNLARSKCVGGLCLRVKVKKIKMAELEQ